MKTWKKILAMLLALSVIFALSACGGSSSTAASTSDGAPEAVSAEAPPEAASGAVAEVAETTDNGEPVYGGTLTMYFQNLMTDYDPAGPDFQNYMLWYERLWEIDWSKTDNSFDIVDATNIDGQIAKDWSWDPDAKKFTVNIRDDICFQTKEGDYNIYGGRKLVAEDIKWSYDRLLGTGSGFTEPYPGMVDWASTLYMIDSIETEGDTTVIFNFNTDAEVAVDDLMVASVNIAGHEWDELTDDQKADWHYSVGTGPYLITDYDEGYNMTFTKNENYYDYDERHPENKLPYLDTIVMTKLEDTATLQSEFIAGKMDFVGHSWSVFGPSEEQQIEDSMDPSTYKIYSLSSTGTTIVMKQSNEPLQNKQVREAMQYAINLEEIGKVYLELDETKVDSLFSSKSAYSSFSEWDPELLESYTTYDPDKAKELLKEAGYADGFEFDFTYVDTGDTQNLYMMAQQYLADVGITMNLIPSTDHATFISALTSDDSLACGPGNFGNTSISMTTDNWRSGGMEYSLGGDDKLDGLIDAARQATTQEDRTKNYKEADYYVASEHLQLYITPVQTIKYFTNAKIAGYNGENMYTSYNCGTILARIWSTTGA